jgi:ABC-type transporter Mla maintaining outer membrane lipid asymmetry ATPase subunit MlaF
MTTTRDTTSIRLRGVRRSFASGDPAVGDVLAVDGIDLDVRPGEIVALLGPNGAGKTTTLDMVLGFTQPSDGEIAVLGQDPHEAVLSGRVAAVLQTGGLLRDLTVRESVELIASTHPDPRSVDDVLDQAGLQAIEGQRVQSCSGGEQQRLRFALALLGNPDLLGWTRQLGLTPMRPVEFVAVKAATAMTIAAAPIAIVFGIGALTGASAPLHVWAFSALVLIVGAMTFALYGLGFGLAFRSEAAVSAAGGALVVMSFFGNIFVPLTGWQLTVAKFTPLYGYVSLARRSLTGGHTIDPDTNELIPEPLWQVLLNVGFWAAAFALLTITMVGRSRGRQ